MPRILNAIVSPPLIPGPYPESLTRNKCHLMEALYGVVDLAEVRRYLAAQGRRIPVPYAVTLLRSPGGLP